MSEPKKTTVAQRMSLAFAVAVVDWRGPITRYLGIDIGQSTGVCYVDLERRISLTMQCSPDELAYALYSVEAEKHPAQVWAREMPHTSVRPPTKKKAKGKRQFSLGGDDDGDDDGATPMTGLSLFRLGISAGIATRAASPFILSNAIFYEPMAASWRATLGLNGGKRKEVNERVHLWAEATARRQMRTRTGHAAFDEANAFGLTSATIHTVRSILNAPKQRALAL